MSDALDSFESDWDDEAEQVVSELMERLGEGSPQPRLEPVRRAVDLLGDPQRAYPVIQIAGTNGKTSTSRMIDSLLRAHGLRPGLLTSPHLVKFNERIVIDGEPISDERLVANWRDIEPYLGIVDRELEAADEAPLTYFEALVILAFAAFADAPVDVAVIEVGMGGEWDATNVADAQIAVFTPVALDHQARLGSTIAEIARTKAGIIKPAAIVVSAEQDPDAAAEIERAAALMEASVSFEGRDFTATSTVGVGGQLVSVTGLAGSYQEVYVPLYGDHQAHNAAVALAAVEAFLGSDGGALDTDVVAEGFGTATSPGRLQLVGIEPTVLVDAAHNPHGAESLAAALGTYFTFDRVVAVVAVLGDKDAAGMLRALEGVVDEFVVTFAPSDRTLDVDELANIAVGIVGPERVRVETALATALDVARDDIRDSAKGAVLVFGSIALVGRVVEIAAEQEWKAGS
ncbi:MAG: folylpolyglutamate synthase/dihydrofolate synthase family protein [Naasia sp.]